MSNSNKNPWIFYLEKNSDGAYLIHIEGTGKIIGISLVLKLFTFLALSRFWEVTGN